MANEATINSGLSINNSPLSYTAKPGSFRATVTGVKGPVPGAFEVSTEGTDVDLSELTTPAFCRIMNLDSTNFVEYGIWDPDISKFYPLGEIQAGETYILRLSRNLFAEYGTGTGTSGPDTNTFRFKADSAALDVIVEAFED